MPAPVVAGFGFSAGDVAFDLSDLDSVLGKIEATGATHCELNLARYGLIVGGRVLTDKVERMRRICSRRRLIFTGHGALAVNFMDRANLALHRRSFLAMLEVCGALDIKILVHHTGIVPAAGTTEIEAAHALERETLRDMGDEAARRSVRIGVETVFVETASRYTADPFRLADEIESIGHPNVMGTLDISHCYIMTTFRQLDFRAAIRRFAEVANHVHIHDSFGMPQSLKGYSWSEDMAFGMGDLHLPPGWGDIPWDDIMPELALRPGSILNVELAARFRSEFEIVADVMRRLVAITGTRAAANAATGQ